MATPDELLKQARGRSITEVAQTGFAAWILAVVTSVIAGVQTFFEILVIVPLNVVGDLINASANAFFLEPFGVISSGADTTSSSLDVFGFIALPVSVAVVLATIFIVALYLRQRSTSDLLPGTMTDFLGDFLGTEEEGER